MVAFDEFLAATVIVRTVPAGQLAGAVTEKCASASTVHGTGCMIAVQEWNTAVTM